MKNIGYPIGIGDADGMLVIVDGESLSATLPGLKVSEKHGAAFEGFDTVEVDLHFVHRR